MQKDSNPGVFFEIRGGRYEKKRLCSSRFPNCQESPGPGRWDLL